MRVFLHIASGSHMGMKVQIPENGTVRVGRLEGGIAIPEDDMLSGTHFEIACAGGQVTLRDLKSTNGTFLNSKTVADSVLQDGDRISAGKTHFSVRIEARTGPNVIEGAEARRATVHRPPRPTPEVNAPLAADPFPEMVSVRSTTTIGRPKESAATPEGQLRSAAATGRLLAILDAARAPEVLPTLLLSEARHESLFEWPEAREVEDAAPYLVEVAADSKILDGLLRDGWGNAWGIYLLSDEPFESSLDHLRRLLMVDGSKGEAFLFRFYDPRVLRRFLPACDVEQARIFFDCIERWMCEGEEPETLHRFDRDAIDSPDESLDRSEWEPVFLELEKLALPAHGPRETSLAASRKRSSTRASSEES